MIQIFTAIVLWSAIHAELRFADLLKSLIIRAVHQINEGTEWPDRLTRW